MPIGFRQPKNADLVEDSVKLLTAGIVKVELKGVIGGYIVKARLEVRRDIPYRLEPSPRRLFFECPKVGS